MSVENYLIRALNVTRLSSDSLYLLQTKEKAIGRLLSSSDIQSLYRLDSIKSAWGIPDKNEDCAKHNARLRDSMREKGLIPQYGDFDHGEVEAAHEFDDKIRLAYDKMEIDLSYQGGKKSFRAQLEAEDRKMASTGEQ